MNLNLKNEKGFVLVYGIMLTSLFLMALLTLTLVQKKVLVEKQTLNFCIKYQTETFKLVLKPIRQLFSLNPQARLLRIKMNAAKVKMATALAARNPILIAKHYAEINKIRSKQLKLDNQQKILFQQSKVIFQEKNKNWEIQFKNYLAKVSSAAKPVFILNIEKLKFGKTELQISPESWSEIAPIYIVNPGFSQKQILQSNWSIRLAADNRKFESALNFLNKISWDQGCGVTLITKAENQWDIKTAMGKYL